MVSHKKYNLSANEGCVIFLTFKLITCYIGGFTLKMKSQSIAYLLNESEHIYWTLDLEGEVHSIWDSWTSGLQECKGNGFFEVGRVGNNFWSGPKNLNFLDAWVPLPKSTSPKKFVGGELNILHNFLSLLCIVDNFKIVVPFKLPTTVLPFQYDTFVNHRRKQVIFLRCHLLIYMTNGVNLSYY